MLADDDLHTSKQVEITHSGNHLSPKGNCKFAGQENVTLDGKLGSKSRGPTLIEDDDPRVRRLTRRQTLLSTVEMPGTVVAWQPIRL